MSEIDFSRFDAVTFDCYGTLIDWEQGILNALQPVLAPHGIDAERRTSCSSATRATRRRSRPATTCRYREVLARVAARARAASSASAPPTTTPAAFAQAIGDWPAFHDTAPALRRLHERFRLGVITNCDRDLFALSNRRLGVTLRLDRHRRGRAGPTSRATLRSSSRSRRSTCPATASSTPPRASSTTTSRPSCSA